MGGHIRSRDTRLGSPLHTIITYRHKDLMCSFTRCHFYLGSSRYEASPVSQYCKTRRPSIAAASQLGHSQHVVGSRNSSG